MAKMNGRPAGVWRGAIDDAFGKQRPSHKTRESGVHAFQALEVKKGGLAPSGQVGVDQRYSTGKALFVWKFNVSRQRPRASQAHSVECGGCEVLCRKSQ